MLVLKEHILDVPVMSLQTGEEIARTETPIIDPRQLVIVAFYCSGTRLDYSPAVLHTEDIREVSSLGYIVDSAEDLMPEDGLVRLKEILNFKFQLLDKHVIEESGRKIGKVTNYATDTGSFQIQQLHVTPGLLKAFSTSHVIIGRRQIVEITDRAIIVRTPTIKVGDKSAAPAHTPIDNPFRRPRTEPEVARSTSDQ